MELYETIIKKGKISDPTAQVYIWGIPLFIIFASVWAIYGMNFTTTKLKANETEFYQSGTYFLLTIFFSLMIGLSIYQLWRGEKILKTIFCKEDSSVKEKERAIEELKVSNKWVLDKSDKNFYRFWENNIILQSYYITIVYDEKGFYINSYPSLNRVIDFGKSLKRSLEICEEIKRIT